MAEVMGSQAEKRENVSVRQAAAGTSHTVGGLGRRSPRKSKSPSRKRRLEGRQGAILMNGPSCVPQHDLLTVLVLRP